MKLAGFLLLAFLSSIAKAGYLNIDVLNDDIISGQYIETVNGSTFAIKFETQLVRDEIVSATEMQIPTQNSHHEISVLKIPTSDMEKLKVTHMYEIILQAARDTADNIRETNFPFEMNRLSAIYREIANLFDEKIRKKSRNQFYYSLLYHSTIVGSAIRILEGATNESEVCSPFVKYQLGYTPFVCEQDLMLLISDQNENKPDNPIEGQALDRSKRECWLWGPYPQHWGCCDIYFIIIPCRQKHYKCWWYDCICQCCDHWYCGWRCRAEYYCPCKINCFLRTEIG